MELRRFDFDVLSHALQIAKTSDEFPKEADWQDRLNKLEFIFTSYSKHWLKDDIKLEEPAEDLLKAIKEREEAEKKLRNATKIYNHTVEVREKFFTKGLGLVLCSGLGMLTALYLYKYLPFVSKIILGIGFFWLFGYWWLSITDK